MKSTKNLWYLVAIRDKLELPVFYAKTAQEVADFLNVEVTAVYKAFVRANKIKSIVAYCAGYQIERVLMEDGCL